MVQVITFEIPGEPVAQGRPRFSTQGGFTRAIDPPKSRHYKQHVQNVARAYAPETPFDGPLEVRLVFYRPMLKNFSKKRKKEAEDGIYRPTTRPDVDNHVKGVLDGLNGLLFKDDAQIITLVAEKYYSDNPRVFVEIIEL